MSAVESSSPTYSVRLKEFSPSDKWIPDERIEKVKSIAIGIIVGLCVFVAMASLFYVLEKHCTWFSVSQDAMKIFNIFKDVHPILDVAWKGVWRGFVVLGSPIFEEVLFRGILNDGIERRHGEKQTLIEKIIRIALVSIIFGACHLSPFQNTVSNLVIFGATTGLGVVLALLREKRKDLVAPIAAHIIYNLAATL